MWTLHLRLLLETGPPFYMVIRATRKFSHLKCKESTFILKLWVMVQPRKSNPRPLQSCALPTELIPPVQSETQNNVEFQNTRVPAAWCSQINHYTVVLSHSFRPCSYEGKLSRKRGSPSSWVNGKNSWPLCQSQQCSHVLWLSRLDRVDPAGRAKVFVWRNVGSARKVTLHLQKGEPAARRVILAKPTSFSHLHGSTHFFNPLNHKINIWILICCPYSFPREVVGRGW